MHAKLYAEVTTETEEHSAFYNRRETPKLIIQLVLKAYAILTKICIFYNYQFQPTCNDCVSWQSNLTHCLLDLQIKKATKKATIHDSSWLNIKLLLMTTTMTSLQLRNDSSYNFYRFIQSCDLFLYIDTMLSS